MIAEIGAGVEPQIEDLAQAFGAELGLTALVDEADDGDPLVAKRLQEALGHRADAGEACAGPPSPPRGRSSIVIATSRPAGSARLAGRRTRGGCPATACPGVQAAPQRSLRTVTFSPRIFVARSASMTSSAIVSGTSTSEKPSLISIAPIERDSMPASPVMAPTRSPGRMPGAAAGADEQPDHLPRSSSARRIARHAGRAPASADVAAAPSRMASAAPRPPGSRGRRRRRRPRHAPAATAAAAMSTMSNSFGERFDDDAGVIEVAGEQPLAQRRARDLEPARAQVGDRRDRRDLDLLLRRRFDGAQQAMLARLGERDRGAAAAGAARAADAVHVGLGRGRHVVVDDVRQPLDVEAARGDVGGDEQIGLARRESGPSRGRAARCSMPPCSASARWPCALSISTSVSTSSRVRQKTSADVRILDVEHALERRRLVGARHDVGDLADARQLAGGRRLARDRERASGSCRWRSAIDRIRAGIVAEKSAVWRSARRRLEDRVEILGEAHVEHLVGFVEHEHRRAGRASACRGGCDRARGRASRRRRRRRARARGSAGASGRRRRAAATRQAGRRARTCAPLRRPASPARASARARGRRCAARSLRAERREPVQHRQRERRGLAGAGRRLARAGRGPRAAAESSRAGRASASS